MAGNFPTDHAHQHRVGIATVVRAQDDSMPGTQTVAQMVRTLKAIVHQAIPTFQKRFQPEPKQP